MAWSFRKRIKIAPGININLSKSGVSTTIGPKGAKITTGPNGTYLHTSIPGTGLYSRKKVNGSNSGKNVVTQSTNTSGYSYRNTSTTPKNNSSNTTHNTSMEENPFSGCMLGFMRFLFGIAAIFSPFAAIYFALTDEITNSSGAVLNWTYVALCLFLTIIAIILLSYTKPGRQKKAENEDGKSTSSDTMNESGDDKSILEKIERFKQKAEAETNKYKKLILCDYYGRLMLEYTESSLKPMVEKYTKKNERNPNTKTEEQLKKYSTEYERYKTEGKSLLYDIEADLSNTEIDNFKRVVEAYKAFIKSDNIWEIRSESANTQIKSYANTTIDRVSVSIKQHNPRFLQTSLEIPTFNSADGKTVYYIFPKFIVSGQSINNFYVAPLREALITSESTRFVEDKYFPNDAHYVGSTYKYVNQDGTPDRRFSDNPTQIIYLYGEFYISALNSLSQINYLVSNNDAAQKLCSEIKNLQYNTHSSISEKSTSNSSEESDDSNKQLIKEKYKGSKNPLLSAAAYVVFDAQIASSSLIQRKLAIGYKKANELLDLLENIGIIGKYDEKNPGIRSVLVFDVAQLERILDIYESGGFQSYDTEEGEIESDNSEVNMESEITEDYFNDIVSAAKKLNSFGKGLSDQPEFYDIIDDYLTKHNWTVQIPGGQENKILFLIWNDLAYCYKGLGHKIDLSSPEGLGILFYDVFMTARKFTFTYENFNDFKDELIKVSNEFNDLINGALTKKRDTFVIEECLREFDEQHHQRYVVHLYRFASLIAKADKTVSEKEADWLNAIMAMKNQEKVKEFSTRTYKQVEVAMPNEDSLANLIQQLNELIGLSTVKNEVSSLVNYIKVQNMRAQKGMKVTPISYHCVFTGNPGTGKTTVARMVSEIYKELGVLKKGHLVETDRSGLVAEYVGQTAVKTNKIIDSALDGILFVDEAYSLVDGGSSDYGKEAIATLLKRMEDDRDRLVVILAGYTDDMKRFIDSNPGLQSRFNRYIGFPDYTAQELFKIFESNVKKYEYVLTEEASSRLNEILIDAVKTKDKNFGNGRYVRNLFEKVIEKQANRISSVANVTSESLATIEVDDIDSAIKGN